MNSWDGVQVPNREQFEGLEKAVSDNLRKIEAIGPDLIRMRLRLNRLEHLMSGSAESLDLGQQELERFRQWVIAHANRIEKQDMETEDGVVSDLVSTLRSSAHFIYDRLIAGEGIR